MERITIRGERFEANGKPVWFCGANTPWHNWNDFGGEYDEAWWRGHLAQIREAGVNATRVWLNCNNGQGAVDIDEGGVVRGVAQAHWRDLRSLFAAAESAGVYIMGTLLSFDHFKDIGSRPEAARWRAMLGSERGVESFAEHYVRPFAEYFGGNPVLWSVDLMNEPDWVHEEDFCGKMPWEALSRLFARCAAALHKAAPATLVTVGMSFPKYHSELYEGDMVSDEYLQSLYKDDGAFLDFLSPHYYDWIGERYGSPFTLSPFGPREEGGWGLRGGRPALIGECPALGTAGSTLTDDYLNAMRHGWQGVMPWTSNGVDKCGGFERLSAATRRVAAEYPELVFPR
ncbi:MAG: cellulase (glycosyl hydrolase family 5) [Oscillospiraceae bacterium]|jgi:hypothetical protein|nr:cellulase (glycosyl hydrolase family 5) [Oscillospiraceae bacterium]